jgi:hypothetical protein
MAFSLFICQQAGGIGIGSLRKPGPGLMALGAGVGVGLLALAVLIRSFFASPRPSGVDRAGTTAGRGRLLSLFVSLFVYAALVPWLGFFLSTFLFVFFLFRSAESEKWWLSFVKAGLVTAGNYLIFVGWLGIHLPRGIWGG